MMANHKVLLKESEYDLIEEEIYDKEKCMDDSFHGINSIIVGGTILIITIISFTAIVVTISNLYLKTTHCNVMNFTVMNNDKVNYLVKANITIDGIEEEDIFNLTVKIKNNNYQINKTYVCYYGLDLKNNFVISWKQFHINNTKKIWFDVIITFALILATGLIFFGLVFIIIKYNQADRYFINKKLKKNIAVNV